MSPRKTMLLALALIVLVVFSAWITERSGGSRRDDFGIGSPLLGSMAPDFSLKALDGREVKLSSYRRKGPVVLAFWASWCGPCQMEMPMLETFYQNNRGSGVELL